MPFKEQWLRHAEAVKRIAKEIDGTPFWHAPFDVIDRNGHFYEIKCPSDRKGRHKGECRIAISEDERKFGEVMAKRYTIIILFNNVVYHVPFLDLQERVMSNRLDRHSFQGTARLRRQLTLGKQFLMKYTV